MFSLPDLLACFLFFLLQNTIIYVFPDHSPNLLIPTVILMGLKGGAIRGAFAGMWAGFLMDLLGPDKPGFFMTALCVAGSFSGYSSSRLFKESALTEVFLPVFYYYLICLAQLCWLKRAAEEPMSFAVLWEAFVFWKCLATALASPVIFALFQGHRLTKRRRSVARSLR